MSEPITYRIYKNPIVSSLLKKRREHRFKKILSLVKTNPGMKILDVGCGRNGRSFHDYLDFNCSVLGIDLLEPDQVEISSPSFSYRKQDARNMSDFGDNEFDLVVSIGMMEHICNMSDLKQMAQEIHRVGRQYVIGVPWRYTLIEPHFKVPFFQLMPTELQNGLVKLLNLEELREAVRRDPLFIQNHYMWPTTEQWVSIWPESVAHIERFESCFLVKTA